MKQIIRLTESDLHRLVKESVQKILKEHYTYFPRNDEELERVMDNAKLFLMDYGSYYKDYKGPSMSEVIKMLFLGTQMIYKLN